ncbi:hypothetical protein HI914_06098 [Erysiphe necator]|nr:hypothetical protein HI914_06098 [Erysiphe necator]
MADEALMQKIKNLNDLGLAVLICLIAREHFLIGTTVSSQDEVTHELEQIVNNVFSLRYVTIEFSQSTTSDEFAQLIILSEINVSNSDAPTRNRSEKILNNSATFQFSSRSSATKFPSTPTSIFNVIIAKNLNNASKQVQNQVLELVRTKRLLSKSSIYHVPEQFLLIVVLAAGEGLDLTKHLNDYIFMSHFHNPQYSIDDQEENFNGDSSSSVVKLRSSQKEKCEKNSPVVSPQEIEKLSRFSESVTLSMEVKQYQMDIISFLRLHRAVAGGITASATKVFDKLAKCLATIHNLTFVTPSLVALAARKVYFHRIKKVKPENERSIKWGSDVEAVAALLKRITVEDILEEVLGNSGVEAPL